MKLAFKSLANFGQKQQFSKIPSFFSLDHKMLNINYHYQKQWMDGLT
jgi:hypothetical protein